MQGNSSANSVWGDRLITFGAGAVVGASVLAASTFYPPRGNNNTRSRGKKCPNRPPLSEDVADSAQSRKLETLKRITGLEETVARKILLEANFDIARGIDVFLTHQDALACSKGKFNADKVGVAAVKLRVLREFTGSDDEKRLSQLLKMENGDVERAAAAFYGHASAVQPVRRADDRTDALTTGRVSMPSGSRVTDSTTPSSHSSSKPNRTQTQIRSCGFGGLVASARCQPRPLTVYGCSFSLGNNDHLGQNDRSSITPAVTSAEVTAPAPYAAASAPVETSATTIDTGRQCQAAALTIDTTDPLPSSCTSPRSVEPQGTPEHDAAAAGPGPLASCREDQGGSEHSFQGAQHVEHSSSSAPKTYEASLDVCGSSSAAASPCSAECDQGDGSELEHSQHSATSTTFWTESAAQAAATAEELEHMITHIESQLQDDATDTDGIPEEHVLTEAPDVMQRPCERSAEMQPFDEGREPREGTVGHEKGSDCCTSPHLESGGMDVAVSKNTTDFAHDEASSGAAGVAHDEDDGGELWEFLGQEEVTKHQPM